MLTKQEILLAKGTWAESSGVRETRRTGLPHGSQPRGVLAMGLASELSLASHLVVILLRVLPGGARLVQPRWMPARRILGGGRTCGVSF